MAEPKYDSHDAREVLGVYSEQIFPPETFSAKEKAALELLRAVADLKVPGVKTLLAKAGRPVEIVIGVGQGFGGVPLLAARIDYDTDGKFSFTVNGRRDEISLAFNHAEQRFEADAAPEATEEQRKRSALAAIANKVVSMATTKK